MRRRILLSLGLLIATAASAQLTATKSMMISAARQTLASHFAASDNNAYANLRVAENINQLAVVTSADGGTAFVNRRTGEVMGCSPSAYTSQEALPCGLKMWIDAANHAIESNSQGLTRAADYGITEKVNPFIETQWDQETPYNLFCPTDSEGFVCVTGCVATAMAQVLKYYEYPAQGTGYGSYSTDDGKSYTRVPVAGSYDWANMKDSYTLNYTNTEAQAVATLMRDCGYSVNMEYSSSASGTDDWIYLASAMAYNFGYDSLAINLISRDYTPDDEWYGTIYTELSNKRPIYFRGESKNYGDSHGFLLDGVDTDGKMHVNWGWSGQGNGFYDIDVFDSYYDYVINQYMACGFYPHPTAEGITPSFRTCIVMKDTPTLTADGTNLTLTATLFNYDWRDFNGDIYLKIVDTQHENVSYKMFILQEDMAILRANYGIEESDTNINEALTEEGETTMVFPASTYEASLGYRGKYDTAEKTAVIKGGVEWRQQFTVDADGIVTIGNTTGISSTVVNSVPTTGNSRIYDLNGNRVSDSYNGLKIVKGKKFVEKVK